MANKPRKRKKPAASRLPVGDRLRTIRKDRGWSLEDLATSLEVLGERLDRFALAAIERGERRVSVDEAFSIAVALQVDPTRLLLPRERTDAVQVAPKMSVDAANARTWLRGLGPLPGCSETDYYTRGVSDDEMVVNSTGLTWLTRWVNELLDATLEEDRARELTALGEIVAEVQRQMGRRSYVEAAVEGEASIGALQELVKHLSDHMGRRQPSKPTPTVRHRKPKPAAKRKTATAKRKGKK